MMRISLILPILLLVSLPAVADKPDRAKSWTLYRSQVQKILKAKCGKCHSGRKRKAGLDLTTAKGTVAGSESGAVVTAGEPDESTLLEMIHSGEMPPKGQPQLSKKEIKVLEEWISSGAATSAGTSRARITDRQIVPLMLLRCTACHGAQRKEGNLDLRTPESMLKGGKSGPVIVPGDPGSSRVIQRIHKEEMPPRRLLVSVSVKPMQPHEVKMLESWIRDGLPRAGKLGPIPGGVTEADRKFWAFQSPRAVRPPQVAQPVNNPVDAFLLRKLQQRGLSFSQPANRLTLIRRLYFALVGLPPSPAAVRDFLTDPSPLAYERLVDRLLSSPRYGERWGRHWLDVAGYSDSEGGQNGDMYRPHMYRYRDYVIRAWNADKPYDRFLTEQLAGDELARYEGVTVTNEIYDNLVATGFLRTAPDRTFANITNFVPDRLEVIADEMQVLGTAVLGLTVQCARCHSHKFDPIPQSDYYRMTAIFKDALDEHDWLKSQGPRTLKFVTTAERSAWDRNEKRIAAAVKKLQAELPKAKDAATRQKIQSQIAKLNGEKKAEPRIRALWSRGRPSPTYVLRRGNYLTPGRPVEPGVPTVLSAARQSFAVKRPPGIRGTGRRLAFARWVTQPTHPLTSRVIVNRIWKLHFGTGIVRTLSNFGKAGARPTHPELLDWLAVELVRSDWSIKRIHRLILNSRAFQQSSFVTEKSRRLDPDGTLLSRMPLKRMEAEVLRDSLLSLAGELDLTPFGPPDGVTVRPDGLVTSNRRSGGWRRSVFVLQRRTQIPTLLANFDLPQMTPNCIKRDESLVSPQALQLLNSKLVYQLAQSFAKRVQREAGENRRQQLTHMTRLAFGRTPSPEEVSELLASMTKIEAHWERELRKAKKPMKKSPQQEAKRKALLNMCHAVINSAAFIYVD